MPFHNSNPKTHKDGSRDFFNLYEKVSMASLSVISDTLPFSTLVLSHDLETVNPSPHLMVAYSRC
jgi:hypothetical protein